MKKTILKKLRAFTLIEVLVAMLVLAIGLLGLAGITIVVLKSNLLSQRISEATTIAEDLVETLKTVSLDNINDCTSPVTFAAGECPILEESGIDTLGTDFYPSDPTSDPAENCLVQANNPVASDDRPYDIVDANLNAIAATENFCDGELQNKSTQYLRYYRTTGTGNSRTIVVVVLWQDKTGSWRQVNFDTLRSN